MQGTVESTRLLYLTQTWTWTDLFPPSLSASLPSSNPNLLSLGNVTPLCLLAMRHMGPWVLGSAWALCVWGIRNVFCLRKRLHHFVLAAAVVLGGKGRHTQPQLPSIDTYGYTHRTHSQLR